MKLTVLFLSLGVVLASPVIAQQAVAAKPALFSYKCHLTLSDDREVIRDYRRQPKNQNGNLERLLVKQQVVVEKNERRSIAQVHECVEKHAAFSQAKARKLDEETLR